MSSEARRNVEVCAMARRDRRERQSGGRGRFRIPHLYHVQRCRRATFIPRRVAELAGRGKPRGEPRRVRAPRRRRTTGNAGVGHGGARLPRSGSQGHAALELFVPGFDRNAAEPIVGLTVYAFRARKVIERWQAGLPSGVSGEIVSALAIIALTRPPRSTLRAHGSISDHCNRPPAREH